MKGYSFQWRMAGRRKDACLLVLIFTAVVTIFMLIYPQLIEDTQLRLDEAYEKSTVKGWVANASGYDAPNISSENWNTLLNSGYFSEHATYADMVGRIYKKKELTTKAGENADDEQNLRAFQALWANGVWTDERAIRAFSSFDACDDLVRSQKQIQWLEGYSEENLEGNERICLLSEWMGYDLGDVIPMMVGDGKERKEGIIRLKVVGVYPGFMPDFDCAIPLKTMEVLCEDISKDYQQLGSNSGWKFTLNSFIFTVADNHELPELKDFLDEQGYGNGANGLRISIDDRILQGTVSPIESNLALLEGLYMFFFLIVIAIGFFLCFLLVRGRKTEYAVMRMLGESTAQVTWKALLEQSALCLMGIVIGSFIVTMTGLGSMNPIICGVILLCYTLGAAIAVALTVRVNVMEILRDKE